MLPFWKVFYYSWLLSQPWPSVPQLCSHPWVLYLPISPASPDICKQSISSYSPNAETILCCCRLASSLP